MVNYNPPKIMLLIVLLIAIPAMSNFYHSDHLGSATWITDGQGLPVQFMHYMPYGELWYDQQASAYNERYKFTGKERDHESGYDFFGARYYSSAVLSWLSVDPLADKYPGNTPYMYCNGNPIRFIDSDGRDWTDIDGNKINDHSNIKAYIFYDPDEFGSQSMEMAHQLEEKYGVGSVAMSNVKTENGFRHDWRAMASSNIKEVNLNYHGSNQAIHLDYKNGEYITSTGLGTTRLGTEALNVRDIGVPSGNIMNARLNLNTCHSASGGSLLGNLTLGGRRLIPGTSATLVGTNQTIMESFFNSFNFSVVRGTSAGVSYNRQTKQPEPQFFFQSWVYLFHK